MHSVYSVSQVNSYIKNMFTQDFLLKSVFVKGEVSNVRYHSSGHIYFTLKDPKGTMACVMFAGNRNGLTFRLEDGQQVVAGGNVDVYERDGKYQLYVKEISRDGNGYLYEEFEKRKQKLEEMGMFSADYKQSIPRYIRTLGVVTASTGAAVRDIITVAGRRNPYVQIVVYPAIVQGEQAADSIVQGIRALEQAGVDVIIAGRGGGSIEDLWAFNEEVVAQAIFDCTVPIISAVGHETDFTIADFVADLRAATPSAAAELAVYEYGILQQRLIQQGSALQNRMLFIIKNERNRAEHLRVRLEYLSPSGKINSQRQYADSMGDRLQNAMNKKIRDNRHRLEIYLERLKGLSPLEKLNQGYGFITNADGVAVSDVDSVTEGQQILVHLKNGILETEVKHIKHIEVG